MNNRVGRMVGYGMLAAVLLLVWFLHVGGSLASAAGERSGERILDYAEAHLTGGYSITLRLSGSGGGYADDAALAAAGRELAFGFLPAIEGSLDQSGDVPYYRTNGVIEGLGRLDVMTVGSRDRSSRFVIIRLDTDSTISRERLDRFETKAENALLAACGIVGSWNVIAQGLLAQNAAGDQAVIDQAAATFHGKVEERYADEGTVSVSFDAADLADAVQSGDHRISLQLAIRHLTGSHERRLTIGTPMITTEY